MTVYVVSAEFVHSQWRAVRAFKDEKAADDYAYELYEEGFFGDEMVLDSRVDEVNLI